MPGDHFAFDLGEPDLDLVEPGGVGGREVKLDSGMLLQELADRLSFVGGKMVEDDVNLLIELPGETQRTRGWYGEPLFCRARGRWRY